MHRELLVGQQLHRQTGALSPGPVQPCKLRHVGPGCSKPFQRRQRRNQHRNAHQTRAAMPSFQSISWPGNTQVIWPGLLQICKCLPWLLVGVKHCFVHLILQRVGAKSKVRTGPFHLQPWFPLTKSRLSVSRLTKSSCTYNQKMHSNFCQAYSTSLPSAMHMNCWRHLHLQIGHSIYTTLEHLSHCLLTPLF